MNKKPIIISVILIIIICVILLVPFKSSRLNDGGTIIYSAPLIKIVKWYYWSNNYADSYYSTAVYFFPNNLKNINELRKEHFEKFK